VPASQLSPKIVLAVVVAALGYFVDAYDIMLFSVVRIQSLKGIGVPDADVFNLGVELLNWQLVGLLLGGIFWGILGDKRGRLSVLFGSILLYSVANIANGFVQSVEAYRWLRLVTGFGLAGELGAGITLVSEIMSKTNRGWGTTIIATAGVLGVVAASLVGQQFQWQTAFFVGGGMGLVLLVLRLGVYESGLYQTLLKKKVERGNFLSLFYSWKKSVRYFSSVLVALPVWYVVGILVTFSPEIGKSMGMVDLPSASRAIFYAYIGLTTGDMTSGTLSQLFKNRKKVIFAFLLLTSFFIAVFCLWGGSSLAVFYGLCACLGFSVGYWAVFVVAATEQFGTNIRATVSTTAPNFVRGSAVLLTLSFKALTPTFGTLQSAALVGLVTMVLAFWALRNLQETYGKDLDYVESR
jgi:MFS transporter, putative metabolite:H+ symporter